MVKPHEPGPLNTWGKRAAPLFAPLLTQAGIAQAVRHLETYLGVIQGKGGGTGWDLAAEVRVALAAIHRPAAVVIDVGGGSGDWTAALLDALPLARVLLLEPAGHALQRLIQRDLPRTIVIPAAAGDVASSAVLNTPRSDEMIASLHARRDNA